MSVAWAVPRTKDVSAIASRLSEDPHRTVLLLEAGPDYPVFEHLPDDLKMGNNVWLSAYGPHNWGYTAKITEDQTELVIPRGKATGGSSAVNGQVLPYFNKLETDLDFGGDDFHGADGPVPVRRAPRNEWLPHSAAFELTLQSTDPHVQPNLNYNYYQEPEDLRRMREAIRLGVRMADASIMPDCIRANTNATTIMIGEKCADYVKEGR